MLYFHIDTVLSCLLDIISDTHASRENTTSKKISGSDRPIVKTSNHLNEKSGNNLKIKKKIKQSQHEQESICKKDDIKGDTGHNQVFTKDKEDMKSINEGHNDKNNYKVRYSPAMSTVSR